MTNLKDKQIEILQIANEECAEVIQAISKVFRFGLDTEWKGKINRNHLEEEIGDLQAMIHLMIEAGILDKNAVDTATKEKINKLKYWSNIFKEEL